MSLLQKASIITTPTAYAEDFLYSIKPAIVFGEELLTNGDFSNTTSTDTNVAPFAGWDNLGTQTATNHFTIADNKCTCLYTTGSAIGIGNTSLLTTGKKYKITFTITDVTSGGIKVYLGTSATAYTSTGATTLIGVADSTQFSIYRNSGATDVTFENVSVKEMTDADFDFTRASTATRVNEEGLIEEVAIDTPRIDFTGGTGSILLEPSSTNLVEFSEDFYIGSWNGARLSEGSLTTSPDGTINAHKLVPTTANNTHYRQWSKTSASAGNYTASCFFKKDEYTIGALRIGSDSNANRYAIYFSLEDGSVVETATVGSPTGTSYKIEEYSNDWYKLSVTITHTSGDVLMSLAIAPTSYTNSSGMPLFIGNDSDGAYSWGAQLEQLSYSTSLIPTSGATVTRSVDNCNNAGNSDLINSEEGVLYTEIKALSNDLTERKMTLSDGTTTNTVKLQWGGTPNQFYYFITDSSGNVSDIRYVVTSILDYHKVACKWKVNDFALWIDGVEVGTNTSGAVWAADTLTQLSCDRDGTGSSTIYSHIKCIAVFKEALTDEELTKLTS